MNNDALRRRPPDPGAGYTWEAAALGSLAVILLAAALVPLRDHLPNAEFALAFVIPVLFAAVIGGRIAGICTAVVAALTFDFVYTQPYLSLRIESKDDVWTFVVLLIVALVAAEVGIRARRGSVAAQESRAELNRLLRVVELAARGVDDDDVVSSARAELIGLFGLVDCVYERERTGPEMPRLGQRGALENTQLVAWGEFVLPTGGVEVPVRGRGQDLGRLVLYAADATRAPVEKRLVAVAIADEVGLTLASGQAPIA
jgi:two-component system sensor histidine kinase KdpD